MEVSEELSSVETSLAFISFYFNQLKVSEELSSVETFFHIPDSLLQHIVSEELSSVETRVL